MPLLDASTTDVGVPMKLSGGPTSNDGSVPFHVPASTKLPTGGGGGGGGVGVRRFAMRKSALPFDDVSSVQNPMNDGWVSSGVENVARTFEKSPDKPREAKTSRIRVV